MSVFHFFRAMTCSNFHTYNVAKIKPKHEEYHRRIFNSTALRMSMKIVHANVTK